MSRFVVVPPSLLSSSIGISKCNSLIAGSRATRKMSTVNVAPTTEVGKAASRFIKMIRADTLKPDERPPVVIAPMVSQSELAFRMQCRKRSNARLCWTPMMHSRSYVESPKYRSEVFETCPEDHPLIAQFCGNDPKMLLAAAKMVETQVDGIDINLGCPQHIARRGKYGSFLLEQTELLETIVSTLSSNLSIPVSCKIRLVPGSMEKTIELCQRLEKAGCEMITVHGRFREQNKHLIGACNWDAIRQVKRSLTIPVVANGGIGNSADVTRCFDETGVDAVMSCEAVLENPALFGPNPYPDPYEIVFEYLELAKKYNAGQPKPARGHLFKFFATALSRHPEYYMRFGKARSLDEMEAIAKEIQEIHRNGTCTVENCATLQDGPWYYRHRGVHSLNIRGGGEDDDGGGGGGEDGKKGHRHSNTTSIPTVRPEKIPKVECDCE